MRFPSPSRFVSRLARPNEGNSDCISLQLKVLEARIGVPIEIDPVNNILLVDLRGGARMKRWENSTGRGKSIGPRPMPRGYSGLFIRGVGRAAESARTDQSGTSRDESGQTPSHCGCPDDGWIWYGRMFQIVGERKRAMLKESRRLNEAFAELGIQSPQFEPLE